MLIYLNLIDTEEEKSKFEKIYNNYKHIMFYVAKGILKDDYLSEDAVHNAFINIGKNLDKISQVDSSRTKGYVLIIVRNISLNMLKKQRRYVTIEDYQENIADYLNLEDEVLSKIALDSIIAEIKKLPVIYKDVLYLFYVEDLNTHEIAKTIDISDDAAKKRLQRARKKLAENLKNK